MLVGRRWIKKGSDGKSIKEKEKRDRVTKANTLKRHQYHKARIVITERKIREEELYLWEPMNIELIKRQVKYFVSNGKDLYMFYGDFKLDIIQINPKVHFAINCFLWGLWWLNVLYEFYRD